MERIELEQPRLRRSLNLPHLWRAGEEESDLQQLPMNLVSPQHTLLSGFENLADWSVGGAGATLTANTTSVREGTQSLQIVTGVGVTGTMDYYPSPALDLSAAQEIRLWVYLPAASGMENITVILANGTTFTNYCQVSLGLGLFTALAWNPVTLLRSQFVVAAGSPSWSTTFGRIRIITITSAGDQQATVAYDQMTGGGIGQPAVVFTFDDGDGSVYSQAYPYMRAKRLRGTAYVVTDQIGAAGYMTATQLQEMYAAGWDIANHTKDHAYWDTVPLNQAQIEAELTAAQRVLEGWGLARASKHVAYPGGQYTGDTAGAGLAAMAATGMLTGRSVKGAWNEILPVSDPYTIQTKGYVHTQTLATIEGLVDTAIARGEILVITIHNINPTASEGIMAISDFRALVDYIVSKNLPCLTISELYNLQSGAVTIPR